MLQYLSKMTESVVNEKPVTDLQTFVTNNWGAIMRTLHNKEVEGCSAEGHINHLLSERLSTKALAWSQTGADAVSSLRAYVKNYGEEKIINLVKYRREQEAMKKTGTDDAWIKPLSVADVSPEPDTRTIEVCIRILIE